MDNNIKYFTPAIEDFYQGYEYEECVGNSSWRPYIWKLDHPLYINVDGTNLRSNYYRVPYLTKEQIEAEGWEVLPDKSPFTGKPFKYRKSKEIAFNEVHIWILEYEVNSYPVKIHLEWESSWNRFNDYIYYGRCKDINTLRYISKLLNIQ